MQLLDATEKEKAEEEEDALQIARAITWEGVEDKVTDGRWVMKLEVVL